MDIIGRWFIVTAVTSVVILIGLTGLRAVTPANSVPTRVLHALTVVNKHRSGTPGYVRPTG